MFISVSAGCSLAMCSSKRELTIDFATNTPVVRFLARAAFDRAHQWPRRFTQMY